IARVYGPVPRHSDQPYPGVSDTLYHPSCIVARRVIHDDDLEILECLIEHAPDGWLDVSLVIIRRYDDAHFRHSDNFNVMRIWTACDRRCSRAHIRAAFLQQRRASSRARSEAAMPGRNISARYRHRG